MTNNADLFRASRAVANRKMAQMGRLDRFTRDRWHWWFRWKWARPGWMKRRLVPLIETTWGRFQHATLTATTAGLFSVMDGLAAKSKPQDPADWWKGDE